MVAPGEMLALLGPSGGGKTTLLTALGGRLGGKLTGSITYNGKPFSNAMKRNTGFVTQDDILHPHLTVLETLVYTAFLRLPKTLTKAEKVRQAEAVISELGLNRCRDSIVGGHLNRGVSGGERKRVSIGQEMLINPSLLLLDEPTSGLDSTTALRIVSTLSELASRGRTMAMTIHQPSSRLFHLFHKVILLCEGNLLYYGKASIALQYFSTLGFAPSIAMNPADFLLDLANGVVSGDSTEDPAATKETLRSAYLTHLWEGTKAELGVDRVGDSSSMDEKQLKQWSNSWWTQFSVLLRRGMNERKHEHFSSFQIAQVVCVALIAGLLWWRSNIAELQDQVGLLFFSSTFWGFASLFQAVFTFPQERMMLEKERASGMYRLSSYFMALTLGDLPMGLVLPSAFFTTVYWMAALKPSPKCFFSGLSVLLYSVVCTQGLGLAIGALVMHPKSATLFASVIMSTFTLVGGYYVQHVPKFISWIRYLSSIQHTFKLLLATQFTINETYPCGSNTICRVADFPGIKPVGLTGVAQSVFAMAVMLVGYRLIAYFALRRLGVPGK
ncbi:ATP-binding cassette 14 [Perilla frutescens var. hirtella]|uniref:ATP-binding cassette 14 n=1 Tax=Perilla frutescens var. hirtella TaxID=608512 RepID=A0AAD4PE08_PERFH|nr:ATP-binding cassette 14 [Perilla frutescens var. hirtella]